MAAMGLAIDRLYAGCGSSALSPMRVQLRIYVSPAPPFRDTLIPSYFPSEKSISRHIAMEGREITRGIEKNERLGDQ